VTYKTFGIEPQKVCNSWVTD